MQSGGVDAQAIHHVCDLSHEVADGSVGISEHQNAQIVAGAAQEIRHCHPPKGHYTGPKLTQEEMVFSFFASRAMEPLVVSPELIRQWMHSVVITIGMTGVPVKTYLLSQLLSAAPQIPPSSGARLAR